MVGQQNVGSDSFEAKMYSCGRVIYPGGYFSMLRVITVLISLFGFLAVLANLGDNFISGVQFLVWLVDAYRGVVYPAADHLFALILPQNWPHPSHDLIDLFVVVFFTRNIILTYFLRDVLQANNAPRNAFFDPKFTGIYIDNFLERIWYPLFLTAFYWLQAYLINRFLNIPITYMEVLFLWGVYAGIKGLITGHYAMLPRWLLYPYMQYRIKHTSIKSVPSLFARYHLWLLYIVVPAIVELNHRADTALPFAKRVTVAGARLAHDIATLGSQFR